MNATLPCPWHGTPEGGWSEGTRPCVLGRIIPSLRVFDRGEFDHREVTQWRLASDKYWLGVRGDETAAEILNCRACKFSVTPNCCFVLKSL